MRRLTHHLMTSISTIKLHSSKGFHLFQSFRHNNKIKNYEKKHEKRKISSLRVVEKWIKRRERERETIFNTVKTFILTLPVEEKYNLQYRMYGEG